MTEDDGRGRGSKGRKGPALRSRGGKTFGICVAWSREQGAGSREQGAGKTVKDTVHSTTIAKLPSPCEQTHWKRPLPSLNPFQRVLRILGRESLPWSL